MQVARNLFLWNGRSIIRKGLEIPLAMALDAVWSKRKILEIYLNIAEWGDGVFGAEAAARHDFGKPAANLTSREAALMATALPNPFLRNPAKPSRGHRELGGHQPGAHGRRGRLDAMPEGRAVLRPSQALKPCSAANGLFETSGFGRVEHRPRPAPTASASDVAPPAGEAAAGGVLVAAAAEPGAPRPSALWSFERKDNRARTLQR